MTESKKKTKYQEITGKHTMVFLWSNVNSHVSYITRVSCIINWIKKNQKKKPKTLSLSFFLTTSKRISIHLSLHTHICIIPLSLSHTHTDSIWLFFFSLKGCFEAMAPVSIGAQMSSLRPAPPIISR